VVSGNDGGGSGSAMVVEFLFLRFDFFVLVYWFVCLVMVV
jgi:hypothetical protein